ncbi:hypothetical protein [Nostoc sp.]|uniref:hypothetical protein n=1 Tax=Nostoc sp. TaxID=1180 RepID=UPI002FF7AA03
MALKNSDCPAIVDDRAARRCGQALGINTIGTGGLLILAKRRGIIPRISPGFKLCVTLVCGYQIVWLIY